MARSTPRSWLARAGILALLSLTAAGCNNPDGNGGKNGDDADFDNFPALSDADALYEGWPGNSKLPDEGKADARYPTLFDAPHQWQSPVKSQGSRGVCSIFSAVGLMEHLYIKEGTITDPDFSEQFLQWSVKEEVRSFRNTSGSSSSYNLQAINRYGIVEERFDPYETTEWDSSDDAECTGEDDQPTKCYTNGEPSEEAMNAKRWHLPYGRWVSSRRDSIKAHMVSTEQAVVVGGTFYYQSWNHGGSELVVDKDYFRKGYVTMPNEEDIADSEARRAGHSFVLVGWDDDLEVQKRDGEGNKLTDENGDPIMEKGFFLFRNSWGTGSFGTENPYGAGYGWISMDYVEEYLTAYVSDLPNVDLAEECNDDADNDFDGDVDCDDSDCADDAACSGSTDIHSYTTSTDIPDNDANGVEMDLDVQQDGQIAGLSLTVDISHTYIGDLTVSLMRDGTDEVVVHDKAGAGADDLRKSFSIPDFNGLDASAIYTLRVVDSAGQDVGVVNSWSVEIATEGSGGGGSTTESYSARDDVAIPDNDPTGAFSNIDVDDRGTIRAMKATVDIDHPYKGDLTVTLQQVGLPGEAVLVEADASSGNFGSRTFVVDDFVGEEAQGTWRLTVVDEAQQDAGTLEGWSLEITY